MSDIPRRLKQLEKQLASLDDDEAMLLSELDGFLADILVCPDLIMPGEWLPMVWGGENKDAAPVFENTNQAEQLVGLIMERTTPSQSSFSAGELCSRSSSIVAV
ncbi:yecA family protein [Bradyrhizobium sp. F1.13.1]